MIPERARSDDSSLHHSNVPLFHITETSLSPFQRSFCSADARWHRRVRRIPGAWLAAQSSGGRELDVHAHVQVTDTMALNVPHPFAFETEDRARLRSGRILMCAFPDKVGLRSLSAFTMLPVT